MLVCACVCLVADFCSRVGYCIVCASLGLCCLLMCCFRMFLLVVALLFWAFSFGFLVLHSAVWVYLVSFVCWWCGVMVVLFVVWLLCALALFVVGIGLSFGLSLVCLLCGFSFCLIRLVVYSKMVVWILVLFSFGFNDFRGCFGLLLAAISGCYFVVCCLLLFCALRFVCCLCFDFGFTLIVFAFLC